MDLIQAATTVLIAAAIGAGTNEIAIIAILRYVLPAKKSEIARRVRDIVATELMSPKRMTAKLDDPNVLAVIRKNVDSALGELLSRDLPPPGELLEGHREDFDALVSRLRGSLLAEFHARCAAPEFADLVLKPFLAERWNALRARSISSFAPGLAASASVFARDYVAGLEHSEPFRLGVRALLDGWLESRFANAKTAADLLPPALRRAIAKFAARQTPLLVDHAAEALNEPELREAIADSITASIREHLRSQGLVGELKGMLADAMRIERDVHGFCRRLPQILRRNLNQPENRETLSRLLENAANTALSRDLPASARTGERRGGMIDMLLEQVWRADVFDEMAAKAAAAVAEALERPLDEAAARLGTAADPDAALAEAVARCRKMLLSDSTSSLLAAQFDELVAEWRRKPLGRLERFVSREARGGISAIAAAEATEMLKLRLADFAEESGAWDVVVEAVEQYDNRQLSGIVLQLARSELRWITILGGVIGALVGGLQILFQA